MSGVSELMLLVWGQYVFYAALVFSFLMYFVVKNGFKGSVFLVLEYCSNLCLMPESRRKRNELARVQQEEQERERAIQRHRAAEQRLSALISRVAFVESA